ncbi:holin [Salipaludibacillus aurantiacus]|uniref:Bacteriophage A118-like holin, Hol118 n=1 Tax=Salipaludibacillus aurantiacus TaxID=1601833 RepID=A0A1H9TZD6_9BACI|nr:holin [Salipaludibacillus aurantiacus]SES02422.1 Bacteriophage A118-like holin, Hol118 [Salipaludibacillus aurantiacus]
MQEVLMLATIIAPVVTGVVQGIKKTGFLNKQFAPLVAIIIGLLLGAAAFPFADVDMAERLWAGGISGLASVGLFELGKKTKDEVKTYE